MPSIRAVSGRAVALARAQMAFRARASVHNCCKVPAPLPLMQASRHGSDQSPARRALARGRSEATYRHHHSCGAAASDSATTSQPTAEQVAAPAGSLRQLQLYNSLTRVKEPFQPRQDQGNAVSMYVCGVTVYSMSHIGHARVYVAFDVLYRYLSQQLGLDVMYVRNFTDVDDKIINRASELGEEPSVLAQRYVEEFREDMRLLGCLPPSLEPRATEHIPAMVDTIQRIIEHGHAYAVDGDVFFDVRSLPGYGRLSGRTQDEDEAAQHRVDVDARKRSPADFALWKAAKAGEPQWDSPWGPGRPGWHIECSAMIRSLMGPVIDIHGGGRDLQFPHHENELAQSQAAACSCDTQHMPGGTDFVRFWMHNGFVNVDAEKMSKSLGNFFTIREATAAYAPAALRWWLLGTHYRAAVNYTQRALEEASERLFSLYQAVLDAQQTLSEAGVSGESANSAAAQQAADGSGPGGEILASVHAAMLDDLNTPQAVAALSLPLTRLNDLLFSKKGRKQPDRLPVLAGLLQGITGTLRLLGLPTDDVSAVVEDLRDRALRRAGLTEQDVEQLIQDRAAARKEKNFQEADRVRATLDAKGILIMDSSQGTTWRPGVPQVSSV